MAMKLYNTLTKKIDEFAPNNKDQVRIYSCGPTVYDNIHIGNLTAFIAADTLRRVIATNYSNVRHVMNITDIDDKTIKRSKEVFSYDEPMKALKKLTDKYKDIFIKDMTSIGNDINAIEFTDATDHIEGMRSLIRELYKDGFAYIADDGVYFSIKKYMASGKRYGQLANIDGAEISESRIDNDEYQKDEMQDFALWKAKKNNEPAWPFDIGDRQLTGRPGWHIECSVMSVSKLGQPFDIHTGGIDLIFPHHENEIAQSTAGKGDIYASYFVHNEHLLVDGKKMSKSLNNFYTLRDIIDKGYNPLDFRLLTLQSHYQKQSNFSWANLDAAQNRMKDLRAMADLRWQPLADSKKHDFEAYRNDIQESLINNLNTPEALAKLSSITQNIINDTIHISEAQEFTDFLSYLDDVFGLYLLDNNDISQEQKQAIQKRQTAKQSKNWQESDEIRKTLLQQGINIRDTEHGQIWNRI